MKSLTSQQPQEVPLLVEIASLMLCSGISFIFVCIDIIIMTHRDTIHMRLVRKKDEYTLSSGCSVRHS